MSKRNSPRRRGFARERRVHVTAEHNPDLRPRQIARIITAAGLEQARREAEAAVQGASTAGDMRGEEDDHA